MSDPNLRRLLDVGRRKKRGGSHYLVKKRRMTSNGDTTANDLSAFADTIETNDVRSLGLDVIGIDNFDELPTLLRKIAM